MKKPFGRILLVGLVVLCMLVTSAIWSSSATVRAQDSEFAGDVTPPEDLSPFIETVTPAYDPGEGPGLPAEPEAEAPQFLPDGIPLDSAQPVPEVTEQQQVAPGQITEDGVELDNGVSGAELSAAGFAYPGISMVNISTATNISGLVTYIDSPALNALPNRSLLATAVLNPQGASTGYHNHPLGAFYSATMSQWSVFNEDSVAMAAGQAFNIFTPALSSVYFTHTATVANTSYDLTLLDNSYLNNNPDALVFALPAYNPGGSGGMYFNHTIGVYYQEASAKWGIYSEDNIPIPENAKFFVYVSNAAYDKAIKHVTTATSTVGNYTILDDPLLNNNPNAVINVIHDYGVIGSGHRLNEVLGAWYSPSKGKWTIYLNDYSPMPDGYKFNVLIQANREESFVFKADASNINTYWAVIDRPGLNGNPNAQVHVIHNWNPIGSTVNVLDNHPLAIDYYQGQWVIYHMDWQTMLENTYFNVYVTYPKANAFSTAATAQNSTASTLHLNSPQLNNHAGVVFLATQNYHPADGVYGYSYGYMTYAAYGSGVWNILRVGGPDYPHKTAFNVLVPLKNAFTHTATASYRPYDGATCINNALTNNRPTARVFAYVNGTPEGGGGVYLNIPVGVYYRQTWNKWCIYTENISATIPIGTVFNVFVDNNLLYIPLVTR